MTYSTLMAEVDDEEEGAAEVVYDSDTLEEELAAINVRQTPNTSNSKQHKSMDQR